MYTLIAIFIAFIFLVFVCYPFLSAGNHSKLEQLSTFYSRESIPAVVEEILGDYLDGESQFQKGQLSERKWHKRREILISRYIDITFRDDYFNSQKGEENPS